MPGVVATATRRGRLLARRGLIAEPQARRLVVPAQVCGGCAVRILRLFSGSTLPPSGSTSEAPCAATAPGFLFGLTAQASTPQASLGGGQPLGELPNAAEFSPAPASTPLDTQAHCRSVVLGRRRWFGNWNAFCRSSLLHFCKRIAI